MSELNLRDGDFINFLLSRRFVLANAMRGPGPDEADLGGIIRAGTRVSDHGRLTPWCFLVIRGDARTTLGEAIVAAFRRDNPEAKEARVKFESIRLVRAPVVAVVSRVDRNRGIPEWEQILSSGASCQTMLIAALLMGYATQWLTEWYAYDPLVTEALGLGESDRLAGFLYLGHSDAPAERARPEYDAIVSEWRPG